MYKRMKEFLKEEDGMGVVEIIIIIAVLVSIALFFRKQVFAFVNKLVVAAFPPDPLPANVKEESILKTN